MSFWRPRRPAASAWLLSRRRVRRLPPNRKATAADFGWYWWGPEGRGSTNWGKNLQSDYGDVVEFVGLCDINRKRMAVARDYIGVDCPMFMDTEFDEMIRKTSPDRVIVTTIDSFHPKYICRAMELGVDVISEKPMATDEKMVQEVLDTERRTGRKLIIAENYRYSPDAEAIKKIIDSEEIGIITSVDYNVYLNTNHGTSYFRRWHGFKQFNGSHAGFRGLPFPRPGPMVAGSRTRGGPGFRGAPALRLQRRVSQRALHELSSPGEV